VTWLALLWVLAFLLVGLGLLGVVLPGLAGTPLVLVGIVLAAWIDGFERITFWALALVGLLALLAQLADWAAAALGARRFGASRWGMAGAVVGLVAGLFFGLGGLLLGPVAGAVLFELLLARQGVSKALHAGLGTFVGFLLGSVAKAVLAVLMVAVAIVAWLW
jgi:hypothetical protein